MSQWYVFRFDPRPRVGGDHAHQVALPLMQRFDPRPRVGGDPPPDVASALACGFDPRPRVGGDPCHRSGHP